MSKLLGLDIGGTTIKAGIVSVEGKVLSRVEAPTPSGAAEFSEVIGNLIRQLEAGTDLAGVGIGCRGIINPQTTEVESSPGPLVYLEGVRLCDLARDHLPAGVPIAADNDARATAAGELRWGAARGYRNTVLLTIGTGVGGAIIVEGKIVRGSGGVAGHLGHITVEKDGPLCICGNRGCVETYASARAIESEAMMLVHRSVVASGFPVSCDGVFRAAAAGDAAAAAIVRRAAEYLAAALAGVLHAFDPDLVIVGGKVALAGPALFAPLREELAWRTRKLLRREVPVVPAAVAESSGVVGAAALAAESLH